MMSATGMQENKIQKTAKTVDLAIEEALNALNATRDDVDIKIIEEGSKGGIFGIGAKPAIVEVSRKPVAPAPVQASEKATEKVSEKIASEYTGEDPALLVKAFIEEAIGLMGLDMAVEVTQKDRRLYTNLTGDGMGILIGKRGQTIDSLQYIANLMINGRGIKDFNVILDTGNYRKRRRDTLEALARNIARKVRDTRQNVKLEPMSRFERHIIHTTLQNSKDVRTYSEGNEPHRYVVVGVKRSEG